MLIIDMCEEMEGLIYRFFGVVCVCSLVFVGESVAGVCETNSTICNYGNCTDDGTDNFTCNCHDGWTGQFCNEEIHNGDGDSNSHQTYYPEYNVYIPEGDYHYAHDPDPDDPFLNARFVGEGHSLMDITFNVTCIPDDIVCNATSKYRTFDGTCNNLIVPIYGAANTTESRYLDPDYYDGIGLPRHVTGLPSPREISNALFDATHNEHFSKKHTTLLMAWGQFFCHDVALTNHIPDAPEDCCNETENNHPGCFPFSIPSYDHTMTGTCFHFTRSEEATRGCLPDNGHREQNSIQTSYIDLSMVYGITEEEMLTLRNFTGGQLKVKIGYSGQVMMPEKNTSGFQCHMTQPEAYCQLAGDFRVDDAPHLGFLHLAMVREHNRIAQELEILNPNWDDDKLFYETRRILIALFQHITFNEWLSEIVGDSIATNNNLKIAEGFWNFYDETINPTVKNEFVTACLRFGHSMIPGHQAYLMPGRCVMDWHSLIENYENTHLLYQNGGHNISNYARWVSWEHGLDIDRFFETENRNFLFGNQDLPARNIQRGRDHGVPGYNRFREFCGLPPIDFEHYTLHNHDFESSEILKYLYHEADDVDLYAGAISESPVGGSLLGPTFLCLFVKQFYAFRHGDRFWYEKEDEHIGFTVEQLAAIKNYTLSALLCANFDGLELLQPHAFRLITPHSNENALVNCEHLQPITLVPWIELGP